VCNTLHAMIDGYNMKDFEKESLASFTGLMYALCTNLCNHGIQVCNVQRNMSLLPLYTYCYISSLYRVYTAGSVHSCCTHIYTSKHLLIDSHQMHCNHCFLNKLTWRLYNVVETLYFQQQQIYNSFQGLTVQSQVMTDTACFYQQLSLWRTCRLLFN